jgi:hypothetical protein
VILEIFSNGRLKGQASYADRCLSLGYGLAKMPAQAIYLLHQFVLGRSPLQSYRRWSWATRP